MTGPTKTPRSTIKNWIPARLIRHRERQASAVGPGDLLCTLSKAGSSNARVDTMSDLDGHDGLVSDLMSAGKG